MAKLKVAQDLLNIIYPVGSIYLSTSSTNPSNLFGGTWEQIKDKFLLSAGSTYTAGNTGGSTTHYHTNSDTKSTTLSVSQIPGHTHTGSTGGSGNHEHNVALNGDSNYNLNLYLSWGSSRTGYSVKSSTNGQSTQTSFPTIAQTAGWHAHDFTTGSTGGSGGHTHGMNNTGSSSSLPPYLVVYMFKRTK